MRTEEKKIQITAFNMVQNGRAIDNSSEEPTKTASIQSILQKRTVRRAYTLLAWVKAVI